MGLGKVDYQNQLAQLIPQGKAWRGKNLRTILNAIAEEFFRIHQRADDLLNEADPRTTYELLEDWERITGMPDDCTDLAATIEERRNQVVAKLIQKGGQTPQFYIDLAATLGYTVTIEEYDQFHVGDPVGQPLYGVDWMHAFGVVAPLNTLRPFMVNQNTVGDRLVEFGDDVFECIMSKAKPAHAVIIFIYQ